MVFFFLRVCVCVCVFKANDNFQHGAQVQVPTIHLALHQVHYNSIRVPQEKYPLGVELVFFFSYIRAHPTPATHTHNAKQMKKKKDDPP